ncbi:MAG: hypothetical protein D3904_02090 [Candidatus Electrothrix sp. EH2]|nr:hypothetical protein [Candidatus Electrothrix sp. EH2]
MTLFNLTDCRSRTKAARKLLVFSAVKTDKIYVAQGLKQIKSGQVQPIIFFKKVTKSITGSDYYVDPQVNIVYISRNKIK